ncbi:probable polygalacturonase At3g15720 [Cicer arietinum]|uniref:Probable polygalacturonase At3g15720 n=1 Tax=Cicer arietinum TaxID=3827 RepID=A0A1S2Y2T4_CICAR|nr:probable polygalacturonase At3g15720 [Cicer arietinum]
MRLNVGIENILVNVMQFGAHGDGTSDDSQAFASAWDSACNAGGMSTLVVPAGQSFMVTKLNFSGPCTAQINIQVLFFHACNNLIVRNLEISNSPQSHVCVNMCNGATFSHISINAPATSPNTDGFDISDSSNILIQDSNIKSGDDCIAVNGGCSFINATRVTCGPGHGISVGSLGRSGERDTVSDVYVQNCTFIETSNGARIKTVPGGSGYAKHITFDQIILQNVKNPIIIDQNYGVDNEATNVEVSFVTYRGFRGTSASDVAINLVCGPSIDSTCKNAHGTVTNTIPNVSGLTN